jgi:hypothetical protein
MNLLIAIGKEVEIVVRDRPADREAKPVHVLAV